MSRPHSAALQHPQSVNIVRESASVSEISTARSAVIAVIIFFAAHFALLVGVTTPEKFYFDEVHYVPAARQMLEPAMPAPMLNPMHPPLAKQLMALSIRTFGDEPLGWRYPGVLFGSLAFSSYVYALGKLPVSTVATYAYVNPVIAVLLGVLFAAERFGLAQFAGGLVVLCAVVLVVRGEQRAKEKLASVTEGCPR